MSTTSTETEPSGRGATTTSTGMRSVWSGESWTVTEAGTVVVNVCVNTKSSSSSRVTGTVLAREVGVRSSVAARGSSGRVLSVAALSPSVAVWVLVSASLAVSTWVAASGSLSGGRLAAAVKSSVLLRSVAVVTAVVGSRVIVKGIACRILIRSGCSSKRGLPLSAGVSACSAIASCCSGAACIAAL